MKTHIRRALVATALVLSLSIPLVASAAGAPAAPASAITAERSPFYVDDVDVRYLESYPVQVQLAVSGSVPSPCHDPAWTVSDDGAFVTVELWSEAEPEAFCAAVLTGSEVLIDAGSYEDATRAVMVNDGLAATIKVGAPEEATRLVTAGWSFGMCLDDCRAELISVDDRLKLMIKGNHDDTPVVLNHGTLTPAGVARLAETLRLIEPAALDEVYGCPDCADGGAAWVGLLTGGQGSRHDMPFGDPPAELADLYELTQGFMGTLETCVSDELVTVDDECTPHAGD